MRDQRSENKATGARLREARRHNRPQSNPDLIKRLHGAGMSLEDIARHTGLGHSSVWVIVKHGSWRQYFANRRKQNESLPCGA